MTSTVLKGLFKNWNFIFALTNTLVSRELLSKNPYNSKTVSVLHHIDREYSLYEKAKQGHKNSYSRDKAALSLSLSFSNHGEWEA